MTLLPTIFKTRREEEELMDLPSTTPAEFERALAEIRWVNRNLGGTAAILETLASLLPPDFSGPLRILDLGTGSADIPLALAEWGRNQCVALQITAVDLHPVAVETARKLTANYPEIEIQQGNALHLDYPDQAFDYTVSSMFMHHLSEPDAVRLLQEMARMSCRGLIVNDLERHPLAWLGIRSLGALTGKGRIFRNDAPLSVLRGFTEPELEALKHSAGLPDLRILHRHPYRWVLVWER